MTDLIDEKSVRRRLYEAANSNGYLHFEEAASIAEAVVSEVEPRGNERAQNCHCAECLSDDQAELSWTKYYAVHQRKGELLAWLEEAAHEASWNEPGAGIRADYTLADAFRQLKDIVKTIVEKGDT